MKINRILFLFPKWVVLKFDSRPCINSYGGIWSRLLACLVLFRNHTWDCHIWSGYTAKQPCLQGRHFELQCLYSESINEVYCSDGKILVTVLGTIKKLLPLIFSVDWAMPRYKLLITVRNGQIWLCFASDVHFSLWRSWETKCCYLPFDKWGLVH